MDIKLFIDQWVKPSGQHNNLYHFTDNRNLASIKQQGGLLSFRELRRRGIKPLAPGGNQWSLDADRASGMDAYIHLGFMDSHPMERSARIAKHIGETTFLKIRPEVLLEQGVLMTDDVANQAGVVPGIASEVLDQIDLEVIYKRTNWKDPAIKTRRVAAFRYEILVPTRIPLDYIVKV